MGKTNILVEHPICQIFNFTNVYVCIKLKPPKVEVLELKKRCQCCNLHVVGDDRLASVNVDVAVEWRSVFEH